MSSNDSDRTDTGYASAFSTLHREMTVLHGIVARRFDLTVQQVQLLCMLSRHQPSLGELAELLGCDKTNVTGMVDRLDRRELLVRAPDPTDRRVARVVLTPKGVAMRTRIRAALDAELAARLPRQDRARLVELASSVSQRLAEGR
ncbi:MarR family winged helix-turn-helix transcriptional regulator [Nocardia callitridis]